MNQRRQLNIRLDNEPELYEAIKDQAHRMNVSISAFIVMSLKSSLDWQIPFDAAVLLKRIQNLETEVVYLKQRDIQVQQTEEKNAREFNLIRACIDRVNEYVGYLLLSVRENLERSTKNYPKSQQSRKTVQPKSQSEPYEVYSNQDCEPFVYQPTMESLDFQAFHSAMAEDYKGKLHPSKTSEVDLKFIETLISELNSSTENDYKLVCTKEENE